MTKRILTRVSLFLLCMLTLLSLVACTADMDVGENTELSRQFMDCVMADDYDMAYGMVKETVSDGEFRSYWAGIQSAVAGATSYEMEQIGWHINRSQGLTTRTTAYQVYTDTQRVILFRTVTRNDIGGIAGIHFSDVTDFIHTTEGYIPTVRVVLWVVSGAVIVFTLWMLVDCLRRKMKYKVLWAIIIFFGMVLNVTVGETSKFSFNVGLFFRTASIDADPALLSVVTTVTIPLGAILYLCLRKKFAVSPTSETQEDPTNPVTEAIDGNDADSSPV